VLAAETATLRLQDGSLFLLGADQSMPWQRRA